MTIEETPTFAAVLKRYRAASGLTHEQLAERAGLSVRGISDLERGERAQPRAHTVRQLADALSLSSDDRSAFEAAARSESPVPPGRVRLPAGTMLGALPEGELVARDEEHERLRSALESTQEGTGHVVLLGGELGIGKTRLLHAALMDAWSRGCVALGAECSISDEHAALVPFMRALDRLAAAPPDGLRTAVQHHWKRISRMATAFSTDGTRGGTIDQQELFRAITDLLLLISQTVPVVLMIDDLQWADDQSLQIVLHLARAVHHNRVLLIGTFRDVRVAEEHPRLADILQTLSRERLAERLAIRRLSLDETTRLVGVLMGDQPVSEEFASFVYRRTKGIPRLVEQLVRSLGGRLELRGEIGAGAMGRVFKAYDREREGEVAAKLVLARSEIDLDTLLRFQQEGAVLARLDHPHIVDIYDTFAEEHASCIIMELLEGQSLGQILQAGPLSLARAKAVALQVADALSYAHSQEIVHRDIKPDNVMVLENDRVKVTDFGIARILRPDTSLHTMATTGMRMGTPLYMAPEQIEGKTIDRRTDIYALGAMLYHTVTGRPPFEGSDALAVAVKHLQEQPLPPSQVDPAIPADWDVVILKALAKDPTHRFQTAAELKAALQTLEDVPARSSAEVEEEARGRRHGVSSMLGPVPVLGGLFLVIALSAFLVWWHSVRIRPAHAARGCIPAFVASTTVARGDPIYSAFQGAARRLSIANPPVYSVSQLEDYTSALTRAAVHHSCLVVAYDPMQSNILTQVATLYPKTHFASVDAFTYDASGTTFQPLPNVEILTDRRDQSAYLVGYLAGLMEKMRVGAAKHGIIGVLGGMPTQQLKSDIDEYQQGALAADRPIKVRVNYSYNFVNRQLAHTFGVQQIQRGADILFNDDGVTGQGYMAAAGQQGRYAIGVDIDQHSQAPYVLTSALVRVDRALYAAILDAGGHHFKAGIHEYGLEAGGSGYAALSSLVPASIASEVSARAQDIADGTIPLGSSPATGRSQTLGASSGLSGAGGTILFSQNNHWYSINSNGTHLRMLVASTAGCSDFGCAAFSPEGTQVMLAAATSNKKGISTAILNDDGSGYHVLPLPDRTLNLGAGAWSPDGARLALAGWDDASKGRAGIYAVSSSNGGGILRLTTSPDGFQDDPLAYSPDGSRLLFFHEQPPRQQGVPLFGPLFETTASGSGRLRLNPSGTQVTSDFGSPASWSPDGKQVAFTAFPVPASGGRSAVFVENADGTHRRRITAWGEWSTSAHWSPDGAWIVFDKVQTGSTGPHNLFLVRPDGTGLRAITSTTFGGVCCAVWSPDGTKLLFSARSNLETMNRDGTGLVRLTAFDSVPDEYAWAQ